MCKFNLPWYNNGSVIYGLRDAGGNLVGIETRAIGEGRNGVTRGKHPKEIQGFSLIRRTSKRIRSRLSKTH